MKKCNILIIVFNLIIVSNLSYADDNFQKEKIPFLLPQSEQIKSSSISKILTINDIKKRLEEIEKKTIQEEIELETFEEKVKKYKKKLEKLKE